MRIALVAGLLACGVSVALAQPLATSRFPAVASAHHEYDAAAFPFGGDERPPAAPALHQLVHGAVGFAAGALAGAAIGTIPGSYAVGVGFLAGGLIGTTSGIHRSGRRHDLEGNVVATTVGAVVGVAIGAVLVAQVPSLYMLGEFGEWSWPITAPVFARVAYNATRRARDH